MRGGCIIIVPLLGLPAVATASERTPFTLSYAAPDGCPSASELERRVLLRTELARRASEGEDALSFRVEILSDAGGQFSGTLEVVQKSGERGRRSVTGSPCGDVVDALALAAALSIDPDASLTVEPTELQPTPAAKPAQPTSSQAQPVPPSTVASLDRGRAPARRATPRSRSLVLSMGPGVELVSGIASDPTPVLRAHVESTLERESEWLAPSFRLSAGHGRNHDATARGRADFELSAVRADVCPIRIGALPSLEARPCAGAEIGSRVVRGTTDSDTESRAELWSGGVGAIRIQVAFLTELVLGLEGGIVVPFGHSEIRFRQGGDAESVHRVPVIAGFAGLSLGTRWWL